MYQWIKQHSIFKPGSRLGGGWMGDRVACRKPINLCPVCLKKYRDWYSAVNYRPDWDYSPAHGKKGWTTDCDGCGGVMMEKCTAFYPEETALKVMSKDFHFNQPNPNRRLYFSR